MALHTPTEASLDRAASVQARPADGIQSLHDVEVLIELEYLELSEAQDRSVLAHLLQIRHAPPLFPYYDPKVAAELDAHQHDAHDQTGSASRFPPAQLRWGADVETPFSIGCLGEVNAEWGQNDLGSLDDCLHALREQALAAAPTNDESWPRIEPAFRMLLESCLSSRWLRAGSNGVAWMTPRLDEITDEVRTASALIAAHGALVPVVGPFADSVAKGAFTELAFIEIHGAPIRTVAGDSDFGFARGTDGSRFYRRGLGAQLG